MKTNEAPKKNGGGDKRKPRDFRGKSKPKKVNLTPKKKKEPQPVVEKKRKEGYNDPFPITTADQAVRINSSVKMMHPEKVDLELKDFLVTDSNIIALDKPTWGTLKNYCVEKKINYKSNDGLSNCPRVLIITLSSERALELGQLIEDDFDLPSGSHPLLLTAHGGGRKADQIARQKDALAKGVVPVAIGTPGRILRLCQEPSGRLDLSSLSKNGGLVVIDMEYDAKQRDVLGMVETKKDMGPLLALEENGLAAALKAQGSKLKIALVKEWDD